MREKVYKPGDIFVVALFTVFSLVTGALIERPSRPPGVCAIQSAEKTVTIALPADTVLVLRGPVGKTVVVIKGGKVWVASSDCRNKLCMRTGKIGRSGQMIVCAPNRVVIQIKGREGLDGVTR